MRASVSIAFFRLMLLLTALLDLRYSSDTFRALSKPSEEPIIELPEPLQRALNAPMPISRKAVLQVILVRRQKGDTYANISKVLSAEGVRISPQAVKLRVLRARKASATKRTLSER